MQSSRGAKQSRGAEMFGVKQLSFWGRLPIDGKVRVFAFKQSQLAADARLLALATSEMESKFFLRPFASLPLCCPA